LLFLVVLAAAGCSRSTLSEYYRLTPLREAGGVSRDGGALSVGVGPVTLPGYTDRDNIVTTDGSQRVQIDDSRLWAEPLEESVTRVLAENLATLLGTDRIAVHPWPVGSVKYRIKVEVTRMIGRFGGDAWLEARWTILPDEDLASVPLVVRRTSLSGPAGTDCNALAARFSDMLLALSREIAGAVPR
jgi:uncharacterized lipoprotein YmbA